VRFGKAGVGTIAVLITAAPHALSVTGVPLRSTTGVVVGWNATSRANVVTTMDNRVLVIHSLRRHRTGTRVRIRGIKWGRSVRGIKWGFRPRGIKWGIMQARNGTYFAGLRPMGRTTRMRMRGTIVRRYTNGVGVSVPGATFTLRTNPGAWTGGSTLMADAVGGIGSQVQLDLRVSRAGKAVVTKARQITPAAPGAPVPYAGIVTSVDPATGTIVVSATNDPKFPLTFVLTTPVGVSLATVKRGERISGIARTSPTGGPELFATALSDNSNFTRADNAATTVAMAAPDTSLLVAIHNLRATWRQTGVVEGKFTLDGLGLAASGGSQLAVVERAIMRNDLPTALDKLTRVIVAVQTANLPEGSPIKIDPAFQAQLLADLEALQQRLTQRVLASGGAITTETPTEGTGGSGTGTGSTGVEPAPAAAGNSNGNGNGNGNGDTSGAARQIGGASSSQDGSVPSTTSPQSAKSAGVSIDSTTASGDVGQPCLASASASMRRAIATGGALRPPAPADSADGAAIDTTTTGCVR
jgi:hypothetical protein